MKYTRYWAKIKKICSIKDPTIPVDQQRIYDGQFLEGGFTKLPEIGSTFSLWDTAKDNGYIRTSEIKSIYICMVASGIDRLVLPATFIHAPNFKMPELKEGDYLFATYNSIYHLSEVMASEAELEDDKVKEILNR